MSDKLNQTNNSADNNLGHFCKATDFDHESENNENYIKYLTIFCPCFFHVTSS